MGFVCQILTGQCHVGCEGGGPRIGDHGIEGMNCVQMV